jgi:segregation and condensation protein A
MSYKVKLEIFEGPFDLLVYLIERAEMNIYDIRIAEITEQYLAAIDEYKSQNIDISTEFLVLAATLIEIKSKMLLPGSAAASEEEVPEDPRKELVQKILEYKKFKQAAQLLEGREETILDRWYKPQEDLAEYDNDHAFDVLVLDPDRFLTVFKEFLEKKRRLEEIHTRYDRSVHSRTRIGIRDKMRQIRKYLSVSRKITFRDVMSECEDRYEVAVAFVAMLEMMRSGRIKVKQRVSFGEIMIEGKEQ